MANNDYLKDNRFLNYQKSLRQKFRKIYSNRFSFINDEKFTLKKQKLFFNTLFDFGSVAVKKIGGEYYIFTPIGMTYNLDGGVNGATLLPAAYYFGRYLDKEVFKNNLKSSIKYDIKDTAIIISDYWLATDRENTEIYIHQLALLYLFYEKIALQQKNLLFLFETGNEKNIENAINDIKKSVVNVNQIFNQNNLNDKIKQIINKKSDSYIEKIDLSGNMNNIINMINSYWDFTLKNLGLPKTPFWKKERLINAEMEALNADFSLETKNDERDLQIFLNDFNNIFNSEMELDINSIENKNENTNEKEEKINE